MAVCSEDIIEELREEQSNPQDSSYCVVGRHGVINCELCCMFKWQLMDVALNKNGSLSLIYLFSSCSR